VTLTPQAQTTAINGSALDNSSTEVSGALSHAAIMGLTQSNLRLGGAWLKPIEAIAAFLLVVIFTLLLGGVISRYVFSYPIIWIDEVVSLSFLWFAMIGTAIAMHRNEHLRLTLFQDMLPARAKSFVQAFGLVAVAGFLIALLPHAVEYVRDEWAVKTPALDMPNAFRVASISFGLLAMLVIVATYAFKSSLKVDLIASVAIVSAITVLGAYFSPQIQQLGTLNIVIFLVVFAVVCLMAGVPIAFCFGIGALSYLAFSTQTPLMVIVGRMDEGMSSLILVSVPIFVLLGCILDTTGMGKAIVDFLASLLGHVKAGMSYVLLGSLFIVSGISGSKVSDMATVAPALFPEMKRRGHKPKEMIALLATGAAMADTVPPSIVMIVLGSVAGVSIAGLFQSGFVIAMVLLLMLVALARWKARNEDMGNVKRANMQAIGRFLLIASPALILPFIIRSAVGGGVATATEVSTIAVLYAMIIGKVLYGGISLKQIYNMLVETAALSGAILLILGTASAMAWSIAQSGVIQQLSVFLTSLPGGWMTFMLVTIVVFLVLGCLLEGLPAILLLAPIMFPIAKKLGIHEIHYSMVVMAAMNIGLMMPPIGIGFYLACRIGDASPDDVMGAIWPYILALLVGLIVIAFVPWLSIVAL
jgi:tripartite ATP-independent transporter DctM subunit